ncbi:hypothetical protein BIFGAL_03130 [Bifidobacterium gallicum DSM 20093 = LMG 11596]|uniref:Alanine-rich protein n=2 Tax=Bifidobacterium gallicum TaxID=78342 RepID=D1NTH2_9BIFI|nr:hypothetical protein BIFGAL_03130 [Bifidobacterium gallicum DSM 20093 = LMG 11596]KFI57665.1 alanine-rich protein [Bifidobacterium gallicum DSM 20093 = LMG 11596]
MIMANEDLDNMDKKTTDELEQLVEETEGKGKAPSDKPTESEKKLEDKLTEAETLEQEWTDDVSFIG